MDAWGAPGSPLNASRSGSRSIARRSTFPLGADGAHAVRNESDAPARFAMPSCVGTGGYVAVYPDSNKVFLTGPGFSKRMFIGDDVQYWADEP